MKKEYSFLRFEKCKKDFQGKTTFCKDILVSMGKNDKIIRLFKEQTYMFVKVGKMSQYPTEYSRR